MAFLIMAKEFSDAFYSSRAWINTRKAYAKSVGNVCERCLKKGLIKPVRIVHHKVYLTPDNIDDPSVSLNWDNLEALCRECHEAEHRGIEMRYTVAKDGRVTIIPEH